jgi:hypothetical protein
VLHLLAGVVGAAGTLVFLRYAAAKEARRSEPLLRSGTVRWRCHARERAPGRRRWGVGGELWLGADGSLHLTPGASSTKRGAKPQAWPLGAVELSWGPWRWDIAGICYVDMTLRVPGEPPRVFACGYARGPVPWRT